MNPSTDLENVMVRPTTKRGNLVKRNRKNLTEGPFADPSGTGDLVTKSYVDRTAPVAVSATATLAATAQLVVVDATAANVVLTLPTAVGRTKSLTVVFAATASAHTCTLDGAGSETINGATTKVLSTQWDKVRLEPYNGNWVVTAS